MQRETLFNLIQKYDKQGPRYTSYPTVPQWTQPFGEKDFSQTLASLSQQGEGNVALYTHIPFCKEKCYFCACNVVITRKQEQADKYIEYLKKEISMIASDLAQFNVTQIHWGGGTPTYLTCQQIETLFNAYTKEFSISENAEISIEIDPRVTDLDQLKTLRELGFNRVSMGVQDFDPKVQAAINRNQTLEQTEKIHDHCKELGFDSINMDFVYGLPYQNKQTFESNLRTIVKLNPDRIAFYNYAHVPWMVPYQKLIPDASLPKANLKLDLFFLAQEIFKEEGYLPVGLDHFAKAHDELISAFNEGTLRRNFMGYTTQKQASLISMGVSSISEVGLVYAQNHRKLSGYYEALDQNKLPIMRGHKLSADDSLRRHVIFELMCNLKLDISKTEKDYNIHFKDYFKGELIQLSEVASDGLIEVSKERISVTNLGRMFIRNIAMIFDVYFQTQQVDQPKRYSRTV